jgi:hypothetical protein
MMCVLPRVGRGNQICHMGLMRTGRGHTRDDAETMRTAHRWTQTTRYLQGLHVDTRGLARKGAETTRSPRRQTRTNEDRRGQPVDCTRARRGRAWTVRTRCGKDADNQVMTQKGAY